MPDNEDPCDLLKGTPGYEYCLRDTGQEETRSLP